MKLPSAYLLVYHGSRDPRPQVSVGILAQFVTQKLRDDRWQRNSLSLLQPTTVGWSATSWATVSNLAEPLVGTAQLELASLPLHEQMGDFGNLAIASGYHHLQIVPLFLLPGVHVMEDIPAEVAIAQQAFGSALTIDICPYLGNHPNLARLYVNQMTAVSADAWIFLSHGSRRPGGNQPVTTLATRLGAVPAYCSVPPSLETQVRTLVSQGYRRIGILPYFVLPGGVTDAIAQTIKVLSQELKTVDLQLAMPLSPSAELADLILDLTEK